MSLDEFKPQLDQLSQDERAELADFLLRSLEPEEEGAGAAWDAEVSRRVSEIRSGKAEGKPADQVFASFASAILETGPIPNRKRLSGREYCVNVIGLAHSRGRAK